MTAHLPREWIHDHIKMANRRDDTFINDLTHCLICTQLYRDPRILRCSHQFCLPCLERALSTGRRGNHYVTCPMCDTVTNIRRGTRLADLNQPITVNYVKEVNTAARDTSTVVDVTSGMTLEMTSRTCDLCVKSCGESTVYCYDCHQLLCDRFVS